MCGIFGVRGHPDAVEPHASSGSTRCSIAGRNRPASSPSTRRAARAPCAAWASCPTCRSRRLDALHGDARHRAHALQHRRLLRHRERAAGARAARAADTSRSHTTATSPTPASSARSSRSSAPSSRRRWTPRSSSIASRARTPTAPEERLADALARRRGRVQPRHHPRRHAARGARSARLASAGDRDASTARRCSRRRRARSTSSAPPTSASRAGRDHRHRRDGRALDLPVRAEGAEALRLRARVLRAPGQPHLRRLGRSRAARARAAGWRASAPRPAPSSSSACPIRPIPRRSASRRRAGCRYELALIRNHYVGRTFIQPTQATRDAKVRVKYNAVREVLEGKRVVMVDDSIVRGTTTRGLVSLVRARRRERSAHARELGARHGTVLLRHRYAEPRGAHRRQHTRSTRSARRSASIRSAISRSTGCWSRCRAGPTDSVMPASRATTPPPPPTRPGQASLRMRVLTTPHRAITWPSPSSSSATARRRDEGHEARARRKRRNLAEMTTWACQCRRDSPSRATNA